MMNFSEKATLWMGLQIAIIILEGQKNNRLQPIAIKALEETLKLIEEDDFFTKKKKARREGRKKPTFLNALLEKKGITQKDIAHHFNIAQQSVAQWQKKKMIPKRKFKKLCDFLSATEDERLELVKMQMELSNDNSKQPKGN